MDPMNFLSFPAALAFVGLGLNGMRKTARAVDRVKCVAFLKNVRGMIVALPASALMAWVLFDRGHSRLCFALLGFGLGSLIVSIWAFVSLSAMNRNDPEFGSGESR